MGGEHAELRDPQIPPKHLATAVSTEKRSQNEGEKGRQRGEASLSSNEVKAIVQAAAGSSSTPRLSPQESGTMPGSRRALYAGADGAAGGPHFSTHRGTHFP